MAGLREHSAVRLWTFGGDVDGDASGDDLSALPDDDNELAVGDPRDVQRAQSSRELVSGGASSGGLVMDFFEGTSTTRRRHASRLHDEERSNDEQSESDVEGELAASTSLWSTAEHGARQFFHALTWHLPHTLREALDTWPGLITGVGGLLAGSFVRSRLRRWSTVITTVGLCTFGARLAIDWGYVTVHWDRVHETQRRYMPVINGENGVLRRASAVYDRVVRDVLWNTTYGGLFVAGFAAGFRWSV